MKTGIKGKKLIKESESLKLVAYLCPANVPTIGYGTTKGVTLADVKNKRTITKAEADALLEQDLEEFERAVYNACKVKPNQNQFDAMVCLTYNIGIGAFTKSSVLRLHNQSKFLEASRAFNLWNKAKVKGVSTVLKGLVIRRAKESALYLEPTAEEKKVQEADVDLYPDSNEINTISHDDNNKGNIQYLIPQSVEEEKPMLNSTINRGSILAGGTALTAGTLESLQTANMFKDQLQSLGEYAVPLMCFAVVVFAGYTIYQRFKQRSEGIA